MLVILYQINLHASLCRELRHIHHLDLPCHEDCVISCKQMKKRLLTTNWSAQAQMPQRRFLCLPVTLAVKVKNLEPKNHWCQTQRDLCDCTEMSQKPSSVAEFAVVPKAMKPTSCLMPGGGQDQSLLCSFTSLSPGKEPVLVLGVIQMQNLMLYFFSVIKQMKPQSKAVSFLIYYLSWSH